MFQSTRTRLIAAVTAVALLGATGFLVLSPAAQASSKCVASAPSVTCVGAIAAGTVPTTVFPGGTNQPAGDWVTEPTDAAVGVSSASETWSMFIQLDDVIPATPPVIPIILPGTPASCKAASLAVGFAAAPTVQNLTAGNEAGFAARLKASSPCLGKGINDILEIYSTHAGAAGAVLKISGLKYNVGSGVASGKVPYKVNNAAAFTTAESNAVVSAVDVHSVNPLNLIPPGKPSSAIPDLVIKELRASSIGAGGVCVKLSDPPDGSTFVTTPKPSVVSTGGAGKGEAGPITFDGTGTMFGFTVTPSVNPAPVATTYTITGLALVTDAGFGPVNAAVLPGPCPGVGAPFNANVRLTTVGAIGRVAGANRYATAAAIAAQPGFENLAGKTVVIARGDNFPDALAASYLAGQNGVPILLTTPTLPIPSETLQALAHGGVTDVVIVGGTSAISTAVEGYLDNFRTYPAGSNVATSTPNLATLTVKRVGGADRYSTAALVAENAGVDAAGTVGITTGTCTNAEKTAIVASGENFPDALAAGGLAYGGVGDTGCGNGPIPLLLTPSASASPATAIAIRDMGIKHVLLMGGTAAVSQSVETSLDGLEGVTVTRIGGVDRQDTAVKLATLILGPDTIGAWNSGVFLVARPDTFPDALAASSLSGNAFAPLYLAASPTDLGTTTAQGIVGYPQVFGLGSLIGGEAALSQGVLVQTAVALASQ